MGDTLHALGQILLNAVPTVILLLLLYFYLKYMFFKPMEQVLHQRYEATEGSRKMAEEALERAAARTTEYEIALRAARSEVYQSQEILHQQLQERETAQLTTARQAAEAAVREAREQLSRDVEQAKATLGRESDALANEITESILRGSAA
jgi:F-type H+-transporting ATPase subunit b